MEFDLGMQIPGLSESQTHRIVGAGRDLGRSPSPAPCSEQGQVARGCVEPGFAHPWGWGPHSRFQCPLPVLFHWIPPRYHWVTKVAVSVSETLGTDSVNTNKICDPHQLAFSPLIQSGQEGFRHIWGWSRGGALRQCVLASRPSAVLEAEWVPHRYFPLLAAQLRKNVQVKSLPAAFIMQSYFGPRVPSLVPKVTSRSGLSLLL